jgi:hypothetical protein
VSGSFWGGAAVALETYESEVAALSMESTKLFFLLSIRKVRENFICNLRICGFQYLNPCTLKAYHIAFVLNRIAAPE